MKHFFLIPNPGKEGTKELAARLQQLIIRSGGTSVTDESFGSCPIPIPDDTEVLLTLGGDGTMIQAARTAAVRQIPILGINMGTLGFLTEVEVAEAESAVTALLEDRFTIEKRMMLKGSVVRKQETVYEETGLNDIVLNGAGMTRTIRFGLRVGETHLKTYLADGIILSTPTGSTAYNLSAGGPIVMPSARMILITPINPHTLLSRSIIVPEDQELTLTISGKADSEAEVYFDNTRFSGLAYGDEIRIRAAGQDVPMIRLKKDSFIEVLSRKLEN